MRIDDFYDDLYETLGETVDEMFSRLKKSRIVSLNHYRKAMIEYKDWKPLPLKEYAYALHATQKQLVEQGLRKARHEHNERIARKVRKPTLNDIY